MTHHTLNGLPILTAIIAALLAVAGAAAAAEPTSTVAVVVSPKAAGPERIAAAELADVLHRMYPGTAFAVGKDLPAAGPAIRVGSVATDPSLKAAVGGADLSKAESYAVAVASQGGREVAVIAGADALGTVFGVYALLEKLGCGTYLSFDAVPPARTEPFSFKGWTLADAPLAADRIVFNWHNFLSGCSAWNIADWEQWIVQSQKMRFNTIMVHAYGNNPMFTFTFNGKTKPVGYLASTFRGRDWGTPHVNDVRRMIGGEVFDKAVFGADASLAPEAEVVPAAQALMKQVFAAAARRGMHICFALDVDTAQSNSQEVIQTLPESARFPITPAKSAYMGQTADRMWLAAPDTPEGYAYYKTQAKAVVDLYPQIDRLVIWIRKSGTPWTELKLEQLPARWQAEFKAMAEKDPAIAKLGEAPGRLGLGKIIAAFQKALKELGREDIQIMSGSWGFPWVAASDPFFPKGVAFLPLDYEVLHDKSELDTPERRAGVKRVADRGRRIIPITWAHHDDGHYIGRPYTPFEEFQKKLGEMGCASYGIIHWTTRPLDLYFKSLAEQVWKGTENQPLKTTCEEMAARCFGPASRGPGGEYLYAWVTEGPIFGRETSNTFIDKPFKAETVEKAVAGCRARLATFARIDVSKLDPASRDRVNYFRGLEEFCIAFYPAEGLYQAACAAVKRGDFDSQRAAVAACPAEKIVEQYARFSSLGGISRGEQGMVVTLDLNWLPYFLSLRQAMALEPVRLNFGPTSHKDIAQGAGSLTFFVDTDKRTWRTLGTRETGAEDFALPADAKLAAPAGLSAADAEVCRTGVESDKPLTVRVQPFLHDVQIQGLTPTRVRPGSYRLRLLMADPASTAAGQRVFDVKVAAGAVAAAATPAQSAGGGPERYAFEPIKAKFLRIVGHGSNENLWNSIAEAAIPTLDKAAGEKAATASADAKGCVAALAIDGKADTRWAAEGDGQWIQFALKDDVATDHIDITWYDSPKRQYKFDLLASSDGKAWTRIALKGQAGEKVAAVPAVAAAPVSAAGADRVDLFQRAGGASRIVELVYPVTLASPGQVTVTLVPVTGKALICGAVLEAVEAGK